MATSYFNGVLSNSGFGAMMTFNVLYSALLAFFGIVLLISIIYIGCKVQEKESLPAIIANSLFASLSSICYVGLAIYDVTLF